MNRLRTLAKMYGIETDYFDIWGHYNQVSDEVIQNLLRSMGEYRLGDTDLADSISRKQKELDFPIPPVVVTSNREFTFVLDPSWRSAHLTLTGSSAGLDINGSIEKGICRFKLPMDLEWGYYNLEFDIETNTQTLVLKSLLVLSPGFCYLPENREFWGLNLGVYSLQTDRNQGIGDLRDLEMVGNILKENGGNFLGILPIHLLENRLPDGVSPYYPLDRMEWNPIYLPLDWVDQFLGVSAGSNWLQSDNYRIGTVGCNEQLDYQKVWSLKDQILRRFYQTWLKSQSETASVRKKEFYTFLEEEGKRLLYSAFFQTYAYSDGWDYRSWPEDYKNTDFRAIESYIFENREEVYYHIFLQWMMNNYLFRLSQSTNMIGFDLPVGTSLTGIESWLNQELFIFSQRVGAPPDDFSPAGQNWGFPPINPWKDREQGYSHFISLLRTNMKFSSFLRIDHIMGLYRLFCIPEGADAQCGTYIRYFFNDLLGILALESQRNQVVVIGEDLGTVPPLVREAMKQYRILSTRVLYFESDHHGFLPTPGQFPRKSMITIGTHDMPPFKAFLQGKDIEIRVNLGLFNQKEGTDHQLIRNERINKIKSKLIEWGFLSNTIDSSLFFEAVVRYLAITPSLLKVINLDDLFGSDIQLNIPGTTIEYPNWRHRINIIQSDLDRKIHWLSKYFNRKEENENH